MALVRDEYDIDEDLLSEKAEESAYWEKSNKFYQEVKDADYDTMSSSQLDWLFKIEQQLEEGDA